MSNLCAAFLRMGAVAAVVLLLVFKMSAERDERRDAQVRLDNVSSRFLSNCYKRHAHSECNQLWEAAQE